MDSEKPVATVAPAAPAAPAAAPDASISYHSFDAPSAGNFPVTLRSKTLLQKETEEKSKALWEAARDGREDDVQMFLKGGASVSYAGRYYKMTALHYAAVRGDKSVVVTLISAGSDIEARDRFGFTPLHFAAKQSGQRPDVWAVGAVASKHRECVEALLRSGANVNCRNEFLYTPLHFAARGGHGEVVSKLIDAGAKVNARNNYECTALHEAAVNGHPECMRILLTAGADINAKDKGGKTPLHFASYFEREKCVQVLIQSGADANIKNKEGKIAKDLARYQPIRDLFH